MLFIILASVSCLLFQQNPDRAPGHFNQMHESHPAAFKGGNDSLMAFMSRTIIYPEDARKRNISGIIYIIFLVDTNGNVENVRSLKRVRKRKKALAEEAIRVVRLTSGMWIPGMKDGKKIGTLCKIPICFELED